MEPVTHEFWDTQAATFDEQPDHGLRDPHVRAAWADLLLPLLPAAPASIVDLGSGTGTLAVLLAQAGHEVQGLDFSAQMVTQATRKAVGVSATFTHGDATQPPYPTGAFDVVLARHVLWALSNPRAALTNWVRLLKPTGRLILIEGQWSTGAGLTAAECQTLVLSVRQKASVHHLDDPIYWGGPINDERYLLLSEN